MSAENCFMCIARIGRDPEVKVTPSGAALCKFSAAVSSGWGDKKTTTWLNCTVFGKSAERAGSWLHKGMQVSLVGPISLREYTDQSGAKKVSLDMTVDDFKTLGAKEEAKPAAAAGGYDDDNDQDVPF